MRSLHPRVTQDSRPPEARGPLGHWNCSCSWKMPCRTEHGLHAHTHIVRTGIRHVQGNNAAHPPRPTNAAGSDKTVHAQCVEDVVGAAQGMVLCPTGDVLCWPDLSRKAEVPPLPMNRKAFLTCSDGGWCNSLHLQQLTEPRKTALPGAFVSWLALQLIGQGQSPRLHDQIIQGLLQVAGGSR